MEQSRKRRVKRAAPRLLAMLKHANQYLHKAVADDELQGCVVPVNIMAKRIDRLISELEDESAGEVET